MRQRLRSLRSNPAIRRHADRFKLQFHRETRTISALALTVEKTGAKMKANDGPNTWEIAITSAPAPTMPKFKGTRCPVSYLSWWIAQRENRPVVDKTGLDGFWDFTLEFVPDGLEEGRKGPSGGPIPPLDGPSLSTALSTLPSGPPPARRALASRVARSWQHTRGTVLKRFRRRWRPTP